MHPHSKYVQKRTCPQKKTPTVKLCEENKLSIASAFPMLILSVLKKKLAVTYANTYMVSNPKYIS